MKRKLAKEILIVFSILFVIASIFGVAQLLNAYKEKQKREYEIQVRELLRNKNELKCHLMNLVDETPYAYKVCKVRYETVKQDSQFLYQNYTNKDTISEIHKQLVILKLITNGKTIPEFAQQIENSIIESRQMFRHEPNCKKLEDEIDMIAKKRDAISTIDIWILMKLVTLIILSIVYIIRPIIIILLWSIKTIKE